MKALDLFCGGGGVCLGLQAAGFDVTGVDILPRKNYPGKFVCGDIHALPLDVHAYDFVWASPPCQEFSLARNRYRNIPSTWGNLIDITREVVRRHPFSCIENVPFAPIRADITLTGPPCGLHRIRWKRIFELSYFILTPRPTIPSRAFSRSGQLVTPTSGTSIWQMNFRRKAGLPAVPNLAEKKEVKGIPQEVKMTLREVSEAVPPPYAELIGRETLRLIKHLRR